MLKSPTKQLGMQTNCQIESVKLYQNQVKYSAWRRENISEGDIFHARWCFRRSLEDEWAHLM